MDVKALLKTCDLVASGNISSHEVVNKEMKSDECFSVEASVLAANTVILRHKTVN